MARTRSRNGVAIAAAHEIPPGRYPQHDKLAIQEVVVAEFLRSCRVPREAVDGLLVTPAGMADGRSVDVFTHERLMDALGFSPRFAETINAGGSSYCLMVARAATAIAAGQADAVLCVGGGKFPVVGAGGGDAMARLTSHADFEYPYGAFIPAMYALVANRHMHERGTTREAVFQRRVVFFLVQ